MLRHVISAAAVLVLGTGGAHAVTYGGIDFDDTAFADALLASTGSWTTGGGATDLEDALTGTGAGDFAYSFDPDGSATLGFVDNVVFNGPGADLAVFEVGTAEAFRLAIGGTTLGFTGAGTSEFYGAFELVMALIDLDDFGIAPGGTIDSLMLYPVSAEDADPADFTAVAGVNSRPADVPPVPLPAGLPLLLAGLGGFAVLRRRA